MAYVERSGRGWRARWSVGDGRLGSKSGFAGKRAAQQFAHEQELAAWFPHAAPNTFRPARLRDADRLSLGRSEVRGAYVDCVVALKRVYVFFAIELEIRYAHVLGATANSDGAWTA